MGNKLSCSCAPLIKKAYKYEETPFQQQRRGRDGHLLRLWAEVFHVSAASGAVRWQQVSEDLVPVNITCIQDSPECLFHITAYNSQVEKILDVRLQQPGTRLGQASECFVYWKDVATGDTWGLNFTSPLDAKQFRELCSPSFKFSRKASSSYSLRLNEPPAKKGDKGDKATSGGGQGDRSAAAGKRKPQSTPSSPSRHRGGGNTSAPEELQCTCMTAENLHRQRNGRVRYTASATLPTRSALRQDPAGTQSAYISAYPSTTSVNAVGQQQRAVSRAAAQQQQQQQQQQPQQGQQRAAGSAQQQSQQQQQQQQAQSAANYRNAQYSRAQYAQSVRKSTDQTRSMDNAIYREQQYRQQQQHRQQQGDQGRSGAQSGQGHSTTGGHQQQQQLHQSQAGQQHQVQQHQQQLQQQQQQQQQQAQSDARSRSKSSDDVRRTVATGTEDLNATAAAAAATTRQRMLNSQHQTHSLVAGHVMSATASAAAAAAAAGYLGSQPGSRRESQARPGTLGRPTSVPAWNFRSIEHSGGYGATGPGPGLPQSHGPSLERSRRARSEVGGRRSLERRPCVDFTDRSPTSTSDHYLLTDTTQQHPDRREPGGATNMGVSNSISGRCYATTPTPSSSGDERGVGEPGGGKAGGGGKERSQSPTIKLLQEYESHLRNALAKGADADTYSLNTFETILSQSMENVVALMKEVQSEIEAIRREEQHFRVGDEPGGGGGGGGAGGAVYGVSRTGRPGWARSYTLPSRGTSLPPCGLMGSSTSDLYAAMRKGSAPLLDTLSIDGGHMAFTNLRPQSSFESTDSKCYLTSSEMSDDERLSLTTAISDDDDGESRDSPYRAKSGAAAAAFQCTGAVRKAGFLSVKKWILRKRHQIELARKRGWKGYWVCLKGTTLLFYPCDSRDGRAIEATPRHLIIIDGAIMQPIPEHPKRDHVFCLSTAFGDAYLFQAPCQVELDNWIGAIHNACGAAFARHRGKTGALHLLQDDLGRLDKVIETDGKLKHMADLQMSVVVDGESRKALHEQIRAHEEGLEQYHCEQYRLRCYMASLQCSELPNPKTLLAHVSKPTKLTLNRLGVFTVSSFHAYICARSPSMLTNVISGRGLQRRRSVGLSSGPRPMSRGSSLGSRQGSANRSDSLSGDRMLQMLLPPDETPTVVAVRGTETVEELLWAALGDKQLQPNDYFLRLRRGEDIEPHVPSRHESLDQFPACEAIEVLPKVLYQVELTRHALDQLFGFSVEAELVENAADAHNQDELCVYVSRAEDMSLASQQGLAKGDEIMVINGAIVSDLDMMYIESVLQEEQSLCMVLRSARTEPPELAAAVRSTDDYIESLVCPPPPSDGIISDEQLDRLIVPSPWERPPQRPPSAAGGATPFSPHSGLLVATSLGASVSGEQIAESLLKSAEQVTSEYCRLPSSSASAQQAGPLAAPAGHVQHHQHQHGGQQQQHQQQGSSQQQLQSHQQHQQQQQNSAAGPLLGSGAGVGGPQSILVHHHYPTPQPQLLHQHSVDEDGVSYLKRPPLSDAEKLRKVIRELVDTEKTYVEHLNSLLEIYLEPMKKQNFLSTADTQALFGNITEIVAFQRDFLASLELAISSEGRAFEQFEQPSQFKAALFALGNAFLSYADKFKLYSSFCASHSKATKILHPSNEALNPALSEFLNVRSRGQHAFSLESYLIKPIQRILKYPLLLQQLKHLTDPATEEHRHLSQALKGMERVAEHINEMQRIHEEYGAIFDHLQRQHIKATKTLIELSPVELLYYGGVDWVNISEFLGKIKKGLDLHAMCFVFKQAVVFLCKERIRQKKKLVGVASKLSEVEIIRYQVLIPVTEVQVRATSTGRDSSTGSSGGGNGGNSQSLSSSNEDASVPPAVAATAGGSTHFIWELIHLRCTQIAGGTQRRTEKVYQLSNSTNEFRNAFLRTIRQIIRESVRNMAVPYTKPPGLSGRATPTQTTAGSSGQAVTATTSSASGASGSRRPQPPGASGSSASSAAQASGVSSSSQSSTSLSAQTTLTEKVPSPAVVTGTKQKPPPPPRAPTTTKSTPGPSQPPLPPPPLSVAGGSHGGHSHSHKHSGQVCCGLCGADVPETGATAEGSGLAVATKSALRTSPGPEQSTSDQSSSSATAAAAAGKTGRVGALKKSSVSKEVSFDDEAAWQP